MGEDAVARVLGALGLALILFMMFAIPYAFVYVLPQPLQVAAVISLVISTGIFILDWLISRR